jgi:mono/diheme cytochrome c family protein
MKPLAWLVAFVSATMLTTGTYAQDEPNPLVGSHLYRSYCLVCHGEDGKGGGPLAIKLNLDPADLSSEQYQTKTVEDLAAVIGGYWRKKDSDMPKWGLALPKTDLLDIAAYISKIANKDLKYTGDTRRGRVVYKRTCSACHGEFGRGKGVLANLFLRISAVDLTESLDMKIMSDEQLIKVVREGKGEYMPPWKGTLSDDDIVDVAAYVRMLAR